MTWLWSCTCSRCGRLIADADSLSFRFKSAGWVEEDGEWVCDECAAMREEGCAKVLEGM